MPARKTDKTSKPAVRKPAKRTAAQGKACHDAAGSHDRQGKPREGCGRRQAGLRLHRQPAAAAARHRRECRCSGGQDASRPAALREVGHVVLWRRRRLVLLLRRLRRPRQAHVRERCGAQAGTAGDAGGDGQVYAGRGARIRGRPRRTPDRGVDETSRGRARCRGRRSGRPEVGREGDGHVGHTGKPNRRRGDDRRPTSPCGG